MSEHDHCNIQIVHVPCKHQCCLPKRTYVVVSKRNSMFCTIYLHVMCKKCEILSSSRCNLYPIGKKVISYIVATPVVIKPDMSPAERRFESILLKERWSLIQSVVATSWGHQDPWLPFTCQEQTSWSSHEVCWVWPLVQLSQLRFCWKQQSC